MSKSVKDIIFKINGILKKCEPNKLFYEVHTIWKPYGPYGRNRLFVKKINTKVGQWFEDMPLIFSVFKVPYYITAWPLYFCVWLLWEIFKAIFVPQKWGL